MLLLLKSHNKGYVKKDGTVVSPFDDKRVKAAAPAPKVKWPFKDPFAEEAAMLKKKAAPAPGAVSLAQKMIAESKAKLSKPSTSGGESSAPQTLSLFGGGNWKGSAYAPKPKGPAHPQLGEKGEKVYISKPTKATPSANWSDPQAVATFPVGGAAPASLNGVPIAEWKDAPEDDAGWESLPGINHDLAEAPILVPEGKGAGAGVIIEEPDGRVWVVHPTNQFAGHDATFPKGGRDPGSSLQATALRECFEEAGLQVKITGVVGDFERTTSMVRYYRGVRTGGDPTKCGWETQAVSLVPKDKLLDELNSGVDHPIALAAGATWAHGDGVENISSWKVVGKQKGSNPGGAYVDEDGQKWYVKFPNDPDQARNEALASELYALAGVRAARAKLVRRGKRLGVAAEWVGGLSSDAAALKAGDVEGVADGFVADAWLANWDVVGLAHDNLLVDEDGGAFRIDPGGALIYRAQGGLKGHAFGDHVTELETLRDPKMNPVAAPVFAHVTEDDLVSGAYRLSKVPDEEIRDAVLSVGPGTDAQREKLADRLIARKQFIVDTLLAG